MNEKTNATGGLLQQCEILVCCDMSAAYTQSMPDLCRREVAKFVTRARPADFSSMVRLPDNFEEDVVGKV